MTARSSPRLLRLLRFLVPVVVVVVVLVGCDDEGDTERSSTRVVDVNGITIRIPRTWHVTSRNLPNSVAVAPTLTFMSDEDGCSRADFRWMELRVTKEPFPYDVTATVKRPSRFGESDGTGFQTGFADQECGSRTQLIPFEDHGIEAWARLDAGRDTPRVEIAAAYAALDSLRFRKDASGRSLAPELPDLRQHRFTRSRTERAH